MHGGVNMFFKHAYITFLYTRKITSDSNSLIQLLVRKQGSRSLKLVNYFTHINTDRQSDF
jgi:hypothetical protein